MPGPPVKPDPSSAAESSKKIIMPSELVKEVDSAVRVTQANLSTKLVPAEEIRDEILPRTDLSKDKTMGQAPLVSPDGEETESDDFLEKAAVQLSRQENERKKAAALKRRNGKRRNTRSEYRERILSGPTKNPRAKVSIGPTQCSSLPSTSTQEYESPTTSVERGIEGRRRSTRTSSASNRQKTRKTGVSTGEKGPSRSLDTGDNLVNDGRSGKGQGETQATEYATINVGDMIEDTACLICNDRNDAEKMVLCDGCSSGCHIFCMRPSRGSIPLGVWMCPACHATAKKHEVHLSRMVFLREKRKCFECEKRKVEDEAVQGPVKGCAECKLVFHTACLRRYHMVTMTSVQDVTWKCRWCLEYEKKRKVEAGVEFQSPKKKRQRLRKSAEAGLDVAGKLDVECGMVTPPLSCGGSPGLKRSALVQGSVGSEKPKAGTNANGISEGEGQRMSGRKRRRSRTRKVADSSSEDSSDNEAGSLGICDFTDAKEGGVDLGSGPKESCSSKGSESQGNAGVQRSKDVIADIGVNTMDENRMDEGGVMKRSNPGIGNVEGDGIDDGDETQSDGFGF